MDSARRGLAADLPGPPRPGNPDPPSVGDASRPAPRPPRLGELPGRRRVALGPETRPARDGSCPPVNRPGTFHDEPGQHPDGPVPDLATGPQPPTLRPLAPDPRAGASEP